MTTITEALSNRNDFDLNIIIDRLHRIGYEFQMTNILDHQFTTLEVATLVRIPTASLSQWMARGHISAPDVGRGKIRTFTLIEVLEGAVVFEAAQLEMRPKNCGIFGRVVVRELETDDRAKGTPFLDSDNEIEPTFAFATRGEDGGFGMLDQANLTSEIIKQGGGVVLPYDQLFKRVLSEIGEDPTEVARLMNGAQS